VEVQNNSNAAERKGNDMACFSKECTTRREFVERLAGAAAAAALAGLPTANAAQSQTPAKAKGGENLVAPCGLYCGACPMYLATTQNSDEKLKAMLQQFGAGRSNVNREDFVCEGCLGGGKLASFCRRCNLRECAAGKPNVTRCSDCPDFPCSKITNFNNDGMRHHSEVLENLRQIKQMGMKKWTEHEEDRWRCPQCKANLSWYDEKCSKCGEKRSDRLFPLKKA
jgi:hypothetical protein